MSLPGAIIVPHHLIFSEAGNGAEVRVHRISAFVVLPTSYSHSESTNHGDPGARLFQPYDIYCIDSMIESGLPSTDQSSEGGIKAPERLHWATTFPSVFLGTRRSQ